MLRLRKKPRPALKQRSINLSGENAPRALQLPSSLRSVDTPQLMVGWALREPYPFPSPARAAWLVRAQSENSLTGLFS